MHKKLNSSCEVKQKSHYLCCYYYHCNLFLLDFLFKLRCFKTWFVKLHSAENTFAFFFFCLQVYLIGSCATLCHFPANFLATGEFLHIHSAAGGSGRTEMQRGALWLWNHFLHDTDNDDAPDSRQAERRSSPGSNPASTTRVPTSLSDRLSKRPLLPSSRKVQR